MQRNNRRSKKKDKKNKNKGNGESRRQNGKQKPQWDQGVQGPKGASSKSEKASKKAISIENEARSRNKDLPYPKKIAKFKQEILRMKPKKVKESKNKSRNWKKIFINIDLIDFI